MGRAISVLLGLVLAYPATAGAQGYAVEPNRIVVAGHHWKAWEFPEEVLEMGEDGGLKPRFVHKSINACLDADRFIHRVTPYSKERVPGGTKEAGSNLNEVSHVMDGDPATFWEPDSDDPLEDWWFELNLGRCVSATKIVLKFVEKGAGDPFLHFKVQTSNGGRGWAGMSDLSYRTVYKTTQPNVDQRRFELPLPALEIAEFQGKLVQYVRVVVTDTKGDRREQLSEAEYSTLDRSRRGRIEYYRITGMGTEKLTTKEDWGTLPPEHKGPVKYYRRELPRLAEVEVWSVGDNLSRRAIERGENVLGAGNAFDGDYATWYTPKTRGGMLPKITLDLGALFWVDTVHLIAGWPWIPMSKPTCGYVLKVSDGSEGTEDDVVWITVSAPWHIENGAGHLVDAFDIRKVRFLQLNYMCTQTSSTSSIGIIEWQIYGEGYAPDIPLTSEIIEVGKGRELTSVEWLSDTQPGTSVAIQTRTGDTLGEEKHYFDASGNEVTEYRWRYKLPGFMKGPVKTEPIPGAGWSPWSRPHEHSGDRFQSPSPKKYLQIRVKLLSDDPYRAAFLKSLSIPFSIPLTEAITGTRSPREVQRLGAPEVFTLKIHPVLREWHPGFNQLLIQTLDMMEMELVKLEVRKDGGGVMESRPHTDWTDQVEILSTQPDTLWMVLPDTIQAGDADEVVLQFLTALYRDGTVFNVFVGNTSLPGVWQQVESEDFHAYSKTFMVFVPLDKKMIDNVELVPRVITPNGDGINDVLTVHFTVGRIKAERPVRLTIYDLWGKKVRHIVERRPKYPMGKYAMVWDGRDEDGRIVSPGVYLVAIRVHSNWDEAKNTEIWRKVVVVY